MDQTEENTVVVPGSEQKPDAKTVQVPEAKGAPAADDKQVVDPAAQKGPQQEEEKGAELTADEIKQNNAVMLAAMTHPNAAGFQSIMADLAQDGVDLRIFAEAAKDGDLSKIPMDVLAEQLGSRVAARAVFSQISAEKDRLISHRAEEEKAIIESVGGADLWNEAREWASLPGALDDNDKAELNAMLAQGGRAAKLAAQEFMRLFKESSVYSKDGTVVPPDIVAAAGGRDLIESRMEYSRLLDEAAGDPQKVAAINKRWLLSKRALAQ